MSLGKLLQAFLTLLIAYKASPLTNSLPAASGKMWNRKRISILFFEAAPQKSFSADSGKAWWPVAIRIANDLIKKHDYKTMAKPRKPEG